VERRRSQRIYEPFAVRIGGTDAAGDKFRTDAVLDNLSSTGLYVRVHNKIGQGTKLLVVVRMGPPTDDRAPAARVAARGVVRRTELLPDGKTGVAVEFRQHRFI
jgi:hypothetical protein